MRTGIVCSVVLALVAAIPAVSQGSTGADGGPRPVLPSAAAELIDGGRPLDGWRQLIDGLQLALDAGDWSDSLSGAAAEVAALQLGAVSASLGVGDATAAELSALKPWPSGTPAALAFRLDGLIAEGLRLQGDSAGAERIITAQAYLRDFLIIGPFDNERGSGFDVSYPPETGFDREASLRGKERDVAWRRVPVTHPLAWVELDQLLRPREQVVGYLATALHADVARDVVLGLGSSGAVKVLLNGETLLARSVERQRAADQDRVVLPLRQGWNTLLIKLGVEEGSWDFEGRLTELAGGPVTGIAVNSDEVSWSDQATDESRVPALLPPGTRQLLEARHDDPGAARLLARYHLLLQPDDIPDRSARLAAERALDLEPDDVEALYLLARANEAMGADKEEMEVNRRLHALKDLLALAPDHVSALLDLADFSNDENPLPDREEDLTARALAAAPDSWRAVQARSRWLRARGRSAEAEQLVHDAAGTLAEARMSAAAVLSEAERLFDRALPGLARQGLEAYVARRVVSGRVVSELLAAHVNAGDLVLARALVEAALAASPFNGAFMLKAAALFEYVDHPDAAPAARDLCQRAVALCPEDTDALKQLVRLDERDGDLLAAAAGLDEILRLDPGDDAIRRHRALISPDDREAFDEPYRWDALTLVDVPLAEDTENNSVEVLRRTTVYKLNPDGSEHRSEHVVFRALNLGGVKALDTYFISYPEGATVQVYSVRVLHPDGRVERAPAPQGRPWSWGGSSMRYYDLPPLSVGDLVDVEYRIDETEPDIFGEYFGTRHTFYPETVDGMAPTRLSELIVIAPEDVPLYISDRNGEDIESSVETDAQGQTVMTWRIRDLERPQLQTNMPEMMEFGPVVDVTTFRDWDAFSTWWWSLIEKEFVTTPAMREKVAELTEGLETEAEQVEAINRFVAQEIRYNSWPFGTHGYEPFSASMIFERRFGDCKDKSILLRQLLAEIDVEAIPVLIYARYNQPEDPLDAAMVGLFNHCIAYLPETDQRAGYYLDGTAHHNPVEYLRADDQGARVLHVTENAGTLHDIPYAPPEQNMMRRSYIVELDDKGKAQVQLKDDSNGRYGVAMRSRFGGEQGDLEKLLAEELTDEFGAVQIESVETTDLEDITQLAGYEVRFSAEDLWTAEGDTRTLRIGFDDLGFDATAVEPAAERLYDTLLDRPFSQETTVLWKLPEGTQLVSLPSPARIHVPGLFEYRQTVTQTEQGIEATRHFELAVPRVELADYQRFRDGLREVRLAEQRTIAIAVTGESL